MDQANSNVLPAKTDTLKNLENVLFYVLEPANIELQKIPVDNVM